MMVDRKIYFVFFISSNTSVTLLWKAGVQKTDEDVDKNSNDESRKQLVDIPCSAHGTDRIFPYKNHNATADHSEKAPGILDRLQNRASSTTGPKAAPKPAHAKDTMPKTELSGFQAIRHRSQR